jgi:hypothetical protein
MLNVCTSTSKFNIQYDTSRTPSTSKHYTVRYYTGPCVPGVVISHQIPATKNKSNAPPAIAQALATPCDHHPETLLAPRRQIGPRSQQEKQAKKQKKIDGDVWSKSAQLNQ